MMNESIVGQKAVLMNGYKIYAEGTVLTCPSYVDGRCRIQTDDGIYWAWLVSRNGSLVATSFQREAVKAD